MIKTYADMLCSKLSVLSAKGEKVDMVKWLNYTTFNIMADMTFGESMELLDGSPNSNWVDMLFELLQFVAYRRVIAHWPSLAVIGQALVVRLKHAHMLFLCKLTGSSCQLDASTSQRTNQ